MPIVKKDRRIKSDRDFQTVFKTGDSFANRQLVLYYLEKKEQKNFRTGLSVSKKIGNAVKRNQIKRYLRQAFYELDPLVKSEYDFVVIARVPITDFTFSETKASLLHVLKRAELLNKSRNKQSN